jgi:hypothetical protein
MLNPPNVIKLETTITFYEIRQTEEMKRKRERERKRKRERIRER